MRIKLLVLIGILNFSYSKAQNAISSTYSASENSQSIFGEPITNLLGSEYQISLGFLQGEWEIVKSGNNTIEIDKDNWSVYPTLFDDYIFVRNNKFREEIYKIEIFSLDGDLLINQIIETNIYKLDVKSLPNGYFLMRIINCNKVVYIIKLLKNK